MSEIKNKQVFSSQLKTIPSKNFDEIKDVLDFERDKHTHFNNKHKWCSHPTIALLSVAGKRIKRYIKYIS